MENKIYDLWINNNNLPLDIKNKIKNLSNKDIKLMFGSELEFGTAGLRGIMGVGSANINQITIKKATLAFCDFLKNKFSLTDLKNKGVVIAHDSRRNSFEFSLEVAKVLTNNDIKTIFFKDNRPYPTPLVSYAIKKYKLLSGIVITASHNEKQYNGYKILDCDGCQYLPKDTKIITNSYMKNTTDAINFNLEIKKENLFYYNNEVKEQYLKDISNKYIFNSNLKKDIKIIFSNLHGVSKEFVPEVFKNNGFNFYKVKEQFEYDPDFSYAKYPNPEFEENFELAIKLAKEKKSDLIILNDPDADRIGVACLNKKTNKYQIIKTNELVAILLEYILFNLKAKKLLNGTEAIYSTVVSSDLPEIIANYYNVKSYKTLTGFKWLGNLMKENKNKNKFILAFEEACGVIISDIVNDKDGIQTSILVANACNYYHSINKTFIDVLDDLYKKYGYFYCKTFNILFDINSNYSKYIDEIFYKIRNSNLKKIDKYSISKIEDYTKIILKEKQNLLKIYLEDGGSWLAIRKSGTEPKLKIYCVFVDKNEENTKLKLNNVYNEFKKIFIN